MFEKRKSLKDTGTPAPHEEVNPVEESMEELEAAEVSALEEVSQELSRGETSQENAPADQPQEAPGEGSQEEETSQEQEPPAEAGETEAVSDYPAYDDTPEDPYEERRSDDEASEGEKKRVSRKKLLVIGLCVAAVLCIGGGVAYAYFAGWFQKEPTVVMVDNGLVAAGVSVETIQLGGDTPEKALEKLNPLVEESHQSTVLPVVISDRTEEVPISKLGITSSAETALKTAMSVGRTGGVEDRKNQIQTARQSGVKCDLKYEYDEASIRAAVKEYCASISPEPTKEEVTFDPSLPERFIFSERKDGFIPETDKFVNMVLERVRNWDFSEIVMPGEAVEPDGTPSDVIANTVLVSKQSTSFAGSSYGRAYNIKLGLQKINGKIVQPGETFSVEDALGNTTDGRIWKSAGAIENGVPTDAIGGGICQVSTTLFNAVVRSDLQIDEWWFHSIVSSYTPIGTDAALNYGTADFRFTNNTEWPVYIVAYTSGSNAVCEIWGRPIPDGGSIDILGVRTGTIPQPANIEVTNPKEVSGGRMGYRATTYKIYKDANGREIKRVAIKSGTYPARAARVLKKEEPIPTPVQPPVSTPTPAATPTPTPTPAPTPVPSADPSGEEGGA